MSIYEASIDDNDPQIIYSDGWVLVTSDGDWRGTMHSTSNIGASMRVRFTGTRIAFICTIPTGDGQLSQASFSVDSGPAVRVAHATTPPVQWQTTFWDSGPLPYGSHLVVMTNTGNDAYLRLDRVDYDPTSANAPGDRTTTVVVGSGGSDRQTSTSSLASSVVSSSSQPSIFQNSLGGSLMLSSAQSGTQSISSSSSSTSGSSTAGAKFNNADSAGSSVATTDTAEKAGPPVAAILGGVLGALLVIALVVLALLYCRRRRTRPTYLNDHRISAAPSRWTMNTVSTPFSVERRSHEMLSASSLMVQTHSNGAAHNSGVIESGTSPSLSPSSPYSDKDAAIGTSTSASMYQAEGSTAALHGTNTQTQHQHQHGTPLGSKHAEFMAERQQQQSQQSQQVAHNARLSLGHGSGPCVTGAYHDLEAPPPAYPGTTQDDVEASPGPSWKS